tara:strand:- start:8697 stop:9620 length:924 start_codon:yes stop_codon:yes gene_type:complete
MKIYLSNINESWVVDRFRNDWYLNNKDISTNKINKADVIWIISPWLWKKIPKRHIKKHKVVCSIYHIDFNKFNKNDELEFRNRDQYVDLYHVISEKTKIHLQKLTDKKIISIPFWVDQNVWFDIPEKKQLRDKYNFNEEDYLIGSFQRDTEGHDLKSPKLIKGPDVFLDIVKRLFVENKNLKVVLTGTRRNYLIDNFEKLNIPYVYYEMTDLTKLNELYNILDLYLVTSRLEGGPQAILECAISRTPVLSTDVGIASEILNNKSIFDIDEFELAKVDIEYAYKNSLRFTIPKGMDRYIEMFNEVYES